MTPRRHAERLSRRLVESSLAYLTDSIFGDPQSGVHPVAILGRYLTTLERVLWADRRDNGALVVLLGLLPLWPLSKLVKRASLAGVLAGYFSVGGRQLCDIALEVAVALEAGDVVLARERCGAIVGRETSQLPEVELCRAAIESVAENTADGVVGPQLYFGLFGAMGAMCYRAINTFDSMFGHKDDRYQNFGWASARLDDLINLPVSRLGYLLLLRRGTFVQRKAMRAALLDARRHPSPNAGVMEAAFAGYIGVALGGDNLYRGVKETRCPIGNGRPPDVEGVREAVRQSRAITSDLAILQGVMGLMTWAFVRINPGEDLD